MLAALRLAVGCMFVLVIANDQAFAGRPRSSSWGSLSIAGTPATSTIVGQTYSFQPAVASPSAGLSFSVSNKPSWASFSIATGKLWGVPASTQTGTYSNIVISVTDGKKTAALPNFAIVVTPPPNRAPSIGGTPTTKIMSDLAYSFRPTSSDPDGDRLTFAIANRPSWAAFDSVTGTLSGTPTAAHVGTYSSITISVSDGRGGVATLPAFSVSVVTTAEGRITLSWLPPTQNTDNSTLIDLAGYRIRYGTVAGGPYPLVVTIANPSVTTYLIENLTPGTYYFVVTARNSAGIESTLSNEASKTIY